RAAVRWQQLHQRSCVSSPVRIARRRGESQPVQWDFEPTAESAHRLVGVPLDSFVRAVSTTGAHAVFGTVQLDREARIAGQLAVPGGLRWIAGASFAGVV